MIHKITSIVIVLMFTPALRGQGTVPFIKEVGSNNPEISHYSAILRARIAESKTGNTPGELTLGYGHFPGTPSSIGLKQTFEVSQSFSFPTSYILRGRLNRENELLAEAEFQAGRVGVMLEARLMAYEYLKLKRRTGILSMKLAGYDSLGIAWQRLAAEGAVTAPDHGRLAAELARARSEALSELALLKAMRVKLDYMSGGRADLLDEAGYDSDELPEPEVLLEARRAAHPAYLLKEREYAVSQRMTDMSRAENLPGIEVGLGSELIGGEHHTGPRIGLSVPLWQNRNMVKLSVARSEAADAGREAALEYLTAATLAELGYLKLTRENLSEMKENAPVGVRKLAGKALEEREITLTEYFALLESEYDVALALADLECEYHKSVARLTDHLLAGYTD